ncbi:hypothetical protein F5B19DRAFT_446222 [Rostrohypoxylon terebratum]|nr:hypothetical protein F5B19DRAFT_446222 [Rostrohypoxylon terebratum]
MGLLLLLFFLLFLFLFSFSFLCFCPLVELRPMQISRFRDAEAFKLNEKTCTYRLVKCARPTMGVGEGNWLTSLL